MPDRIGMVIGNEADGRARIVIDRKGACDGCHGGEGGSHGGSCHTCLSSSKTESLVVNSVGARIGDIVRVSMESGNLLTGAALLYILPILTLLGGALLGLAQSATLGWDATNATVLGAAAGLAVGFVALMILDRTSWVRRRLAPRITAVLASENAPSAHPQGSCCG